MSTPVAGPLVVTPVFTTPGDLLVEWDDVGDTWRSVDGYLTAATADARYVNVAGDTMTGSLTISLASGNAALYLQKAGSGAGTDIFGYNGANLRWQMELGGAGAESGGNAGSDFTLSRFADAGGYLGTPLTISRATGNVGIGTTGPASPLDVVGQISTRGAGAAFAIYDVGTGHYWAQYSSGDAWFNYSSASASSPFSLTPAGNLTVLGGTATKPGGGSWVAPSSRELKTETVDYGRGLAEVIQLMPVVYSYNGKGGMPTGRAYAGLTAEDVARVMPEMVVKLSLVEVPGHGPASDDLPPPLETLGVDTGPLVMALVNAVKELAAKVMALEARL